MKYRMETYIFSKDMNALDAMTRQLNVGTIHTNDVPLVYDPDLPV